MLGYSNVKIKNNGFAALSAAILVLVIMMGVGASITVLTVSEQKIAGNITKSNQAYYSAEAGIEDILFRLKNNMIWLSPYSLVVGGGITTLEISDIVGGIRTIIATSTVSNRIRKLQVTYGISSEEVNFYYGAQIGDGGMVMGNGSKVLGNVFSNGSITGGGTIQNNVIVAGNGNKIEDINVGGNATAHNCEDADITGNLYYVFGGSYSSCDYTTAVDLGPNEIAAVPLPISQDLIEDWKDAATAGGTTTEDVSIDGIQTLGPIRIGTPAAPKNLTIGNSDTLKLNGTIYVTGDITFSQNSIAQLENSYGSLSGVIIADGRIMVENGTQLSGSGQPGSYLLILSTKNDTVTPVIDVRNNALGAVFYTNNGLIYLKNGMKAREITGYKIQIENNAEIQYESGLEHANFTTGPGGSWRVTSWKEIE